MNLRGLVAVSGKPGLFKLLGQNKSGFILESLDAQKLKLVVNMSTAKLASLEDITIFGEDEDLKLSDIFAKMKDASSIPDSKKADGATLRNFFREVAPDHDEERVYASDIKKVLNWFSIIKDLPLFTEDAPEPVQTAAVAENKQTAEKKPEQTEPKAKPTPKAGKSATRLSQKSK